MCWTHNAVCLLLSILLFEAVQINVSLRIEIDTGDNVLLPNPLPSLISSLLSHGLEAANAIWNKPFNQHNSQTSIATLRYLAVVTRHGSRSPTVTYPTDPYPYTNGTFWPDGPGQLTRYGKQQLYASGQTLRMRYNGFLNLNYFPDDNAIRCNRFDRDFMSAACLLAGLYPPVGYQVWNPAILWQPIPIWEDPFDVADLAVNNGSLCPRYGADQRKAVNALNTESGKYSSLLDYLTKYTGEKISGISDIVKVYDVLQMEYENGFKLPKWANYVYPKKLRPLYAKAFQAFVAGTPEMIRLAAGPILKDISHQMMQKAGGKMMPDRLLYIDAAHDTTLQALLSSLGYKDSFAIETSAFMVFELHETSSLGFVLQILYFNSSAHIVPNILDPPNCRKPCTLSKFIRYVKKLAPSDWEAECNSSDDLWK